MEKVMKRRIKKGPVEHAGSEGALGYEHQSCFSQEQVRLLCPQKPDRNDTREPSLCSGNARGDWMQWYICNSKVRPLE